MSDITPALLLSAYAQGYFPMAASRDGKELRWHCLEVRGVIPLDARFHVSKSLQKFLKASPYEIRMDTAFESVIRACAESPRDDGEGTWINDEIIALYCELHHLGHAHSVECWYEGALVGGLYGVALGGAFFGESMFSRATNASKVALVCLVEHLRNHGFQLLDAQFVNEHLRQFGLLEVPKEEYLTLLQTALRAKPIPLFERSSASQP